MLTLNQWQQKHHKVVEQIGQIRSVADICPNPARQELWVLKDYFVTSVSGGSIWLVPVREINRFITK